MFDFLKSPERIECCPGHTKRIFDTASMPDVVRWAERILHEERADAIVACGHSGLLLAGTLQYLTGIPVFAVRKRGEKTVAYDVGPVSGIAPRGPARRWVWVDDFLSYGGTFRWSRDAVVGAGLVASRDPVAVLSYGRDTNQTLVGVGETSSMSMTQSEADTLTRYDGWNYYRQYGFLDPEPGEFPPL